MKVTELIAILKICEEMNPGLEVKAESEDFQCTGHGEDEYCYCKNTPKIHEINTAVAVAHNEHGRPCKPYVQINLIR